MPDIFFLELCSRLRMRASRLPPTERLESPAGPKAKRPKGWNAVSSTITRAQGLPAYPAHGQRDELLQEVPIPAHSGTEPTASVADAYLLDYRTRPRARTLAEV